MAQRATRYKQNRLQQLRGFCFASQTGSMSKAAEKMFLSQPSVSLQIQALERELDARLFDRKGPKIELTHEGQILAELAQPLVDGFATLEETFNARRYSIDDTVRVARICRAVCRSISQNRSAFDKCYR